MKYNGNRWGEGSLGYERWMGNPWEEGGKNKPATKTQQEPWPELLNTAKDVIYMSQLEKEIVFEYNKARWDPERYITEVIEPGRKYFSGKTMLMAGKYKVVTKEGVAALDECIEVMKTYAKEVPPFLWLKPEETYYKAACRHAIDQSKTGKIGHQGSDGSTPHDRIFDLCQQGIDHYGDATENIGYGLFCNSPKWILFLLLVDDGVSDRGHRRNIFTKGMSQIGVSVQPHPIHGLVAVQIIGFDLEPKVK